MLSELPRGSELQSQVVEDNMVYQSTAPISPGNSGGVGQLSLSYLLFFHTLQLTQPIHRSYIDMDHR